MKRSLLSAASTVALLASSISPALAAPRAPDLSVQISGPASAQVYTDNRYTVTVSNTGNKNATNVQLVVDLPLTDTSPTVHVLGTVSRIHRKCQLSNNKLVCSLGKVRKNRTKSIKFDFSFPVSTKTLSFDATATVSNDSNPNNNSASLTPVLTHPSTPFTSANVTNSHCTGQGLTSYFECTLFPSSITSHTATFNANNTISNIPGHTGTWQLSNNDTQLYFEYSNTSGQVLEFNGYAVGGNCFDGLTTFNNNPTYVSPYHVCI